MVPRMVCACVLSSLGPRLLTVGGHVGPWLGTGVSLAGAFGGLAVRMETRRLLASMLMWFLCS